MELIIIPKSELSDSIQASIRSVLNDKSPKKDNLNYASDYLSVDAASEYLRIPTSTLYQYCSARKITFLKRGKQSYFFKSDLDQCS